MIQGLKLRIISMTILIRLRLVIVAQNISHSKDSGTTNVQLKKPMAIQCLCGISINMKLKWNFGHLI
jgi:hypothetical protein